MHCSSSPTSILEQHKTLKHSRYANATHTNNKSIQYCKPLNRSPCLAPPHYLAMHSLNCRRKIACEKNAKTPMTMRNMPFVAAKKKKKTSPSRFGYIICFLLAFYPQSELPLLLSDFRSSPPKVPLSESESLCSRGKSMSLPLPL